MEEKIIAKIKISETGRCESANCVYEDNDTVIEKEFVSQEEAMEFYVKCLDYVYRDGEFVYDPLPIEPETPEQSDAELALEIALDHESRLSAVELGIGGV